MCQQERDGLVRTFAKLLNLTSTTREVYGIPVELSKSEAATVLCIRMWPGEDIEESKAVDLSEAKDVAGATQLVDEACDWIVQAAACRLEEDHRVRRARSPALFEQHDVGFEEKEDG